MLDIIIIKEVWRDHMLSRCSRMVTRAMLQARRRGMLRRPIDVAIDEHDIPSYAKVMNMAYVVFSRYKKGTKKFHRLATLHWMVEGRRLTLGVEVVRRGDNTAGTVQRLLYGRVLLYGPVQVETTPPGRCRGCCGGPAGAASAYRRSPSTAGSIRRTS